MRLMICILIATIFASASWAQEQTDVVIRMSACEAEREFSIYIDAGLFIKSPKKLALKGSIKVAGETFDIFLPEDKGGHSGSSRSKRKNGTVTYTSTYLAIDQNHDGKLESWESYLAELPLRIGDSMFDVVKIEPDGSSITLRPSSKPLQGAVVGRKVPNFEFTTIGGKVVNRDSFLGRALIIECWAPS
ncbi:MAG: hypothetical protein ACI97A_003605 [Planctomycetota bacterium]|jgi:hypothetical protein